MDEGPRDEPAGFVVVVGGGDRIHFLDWGGAPDREDADVDGGTGIPGILLVHGLAQTAWTWAPVARRIVDERPVVAMDLRGHGLSDAPTWGYDEPTLAEDVVAVAEGSGLLGADHPTVVLVGHGFGAIVAVWTAAALGPRCSGLVLVDGGWESIEAATGLDVDEFLRGLDEPPEVLRSMAAFLADRRAFDPATWDADQERAARATVVETHAGRVVPATRPHAMEASVRAMYGYEPIPALIAVASPITALVGPDDEARTRRRGLEAASAARVVAGRGPIAVVETGAHGHNLMRYRPDAVTAAIRAEA